jgi:hypothetical protein
MADDYFACRLLMLPPDTNPHGPLSAVVDAGTFREPRVAVRMLGSLLAAFVVAFLLQRTCYLVRVDVPRYLVAVGITVVTLLANGSVTLLIALAVTNAGAARGWTECGTGTVISCLALPTNSLLGAALYRQFLKVRFGKAILVWLLQVLLLAAIVLIPRGVIYLLTGH